MVQRTIGKLDQLINDAAPFIIKAKAADKSMQARQALRKGEYSAYNSAVLHFLLLIIDKTSPYIQEYNENARVYNSSGVQNGIDILERIKKDVHDGWLLDIKGLVSAEIFSDFLEMAGHLLTEDYKDPAAVIVGSVLEEHLRNLCVKNQIAVTYIDGKSKITTKKASMLNDDLMKGGIYNLLEQKSVTALLDLRNKAAHGKYTEYDIIQVKNMHQNVFDFIKRYSI